MRRSRRNVDRRWRCAVDARRPASTGAGAARLVGATGRHLPSPRWRSRRPMPSRIRRPPQGFARARSSSVKEGGGQASGGPPLTAEKRLPYGSGCARGPAERPPHVGHRPLGATSPQPPPATPSSKGQPHRRARQGHQYVQRQPEFVLGQVVGERRPRLLGHDGRKREPRRCQVTAGALSGDHHLAHGPRVAPLTSRSALTALEPLVGRRQYRPGDEAARMLQEGAPVAGRATLRLPDRSRGCTPRPECLRSWVASPSRSAGQLAVERGARKRAERAT